ncbi:MAG TPA: tRNA uridine-5-carboxymethylaminomethyl(34) synthesis GTPase MnmE [Bacteroidetes bacterium]|nr:tRNA uridine-5-carboxymethylaminomethyl(34) synthesis GTPase MnmE [Bacteroidota bacterium]
MEQQDTICAVSTPPGRGAISVLRISGPNAFAVMDTLFHFAGGKNKLAAQPSHTIHFGHIVENGHLIDEVLVSVFKAPRSYTGEDLLEVSCHGAPYIQQKILELMINAGARLAEPGEFTLRAFLNGKIDLSQAEAVADLIASNSAASHRVAIHQMRGGFSRELKQLRDRLVEFTSLVELELDFSEEEVEFANRTQLKTLVTHIRDVTGRLADSFSIGNVIRNGVPVAIVGKPNVGKSTLLNALLQEDRAIVSEIAGTTRDAIEDIVALGGLLFRFIDTAGIRETSDFIETLGIRKTYQKIEEASVVILLVDAADTVEVIRGSYRHILEQTGNGNRRVVMVINKCDRQDRKTLDKKFGGSFPACLRPEDRMMLLSARNREQVHRLAGMLVDFIKKDMQEESGEVVTNVRHYEALRRTSKALDRVLDNLDRNLPGDLLAQDIREALHYLGQITGEITTDEILGNIFSRFCIGK